MHGYNSCHNMIVLGICMAFILGSLDIVLDTLLIDVVVVVAVIVIPTVDGVVIIIAGPVRNATGIAFPLPIELVATTENV